ncbi:hypothetical protein FGE21_18990, partial [Phaeobacter sp. B1627]
MKRDIFSRARAALVAGLSAVPLMAPTIGHGFTDADYVNDSELIGPSCTVRMTVSASQFAAVYIEWPQYVAGGMYYLSGNLTSWPTMTVSNLATCLGTSESNISNYTAHVADATFATETYLGFSFSLATPTTHLTAGHHEFSVNGHAMDVEAPVLTAPSAQT